METSLSVDPPPAALCLPVIGYDRCTSLLLPSEFISELVKKFITVPQTYSRAEPADGVTLLVSFLGIHLGQYCINRSPSVSVETDFTVD